MKYSKGHFKKIQKSLKKAAQDAIMKSKSVNHMRRVSKMYDFKINYIKLLSKEFALLIKKNKGDISANDFELPIINETIDVILYSSSPSEIKRAVKFAIAKLRLFKY